MPSPRRPETRVGSRAAMASSSANRVVLFAFGKDAPPSFRAFARSGSGGSRCSRRRSHRGRRRNRSRDRCCPEGQRRQRYRARRAGDERRGAQRGERLRRVEFVGSSRAAASSDSTSSKRHRPGDRARRAPVRPGSWRARRRGSRERRERAQNLEALRPALEPFVVAAPQGQEDVDRTSGPSRAPARETSIAPSASPEELRLQEITAIATRLAPLLSRARRACDQALAWRRSRANGRSPTKMASAICR